MHYLIMRKPPSFPARDQRLIDSTRAVGTALVIARDYSQRNPTGSVAVYAVESNRLVRGATYAAGALVAIGQEGSNPYGWDWSS